MSDYPISFSLSISCPIILVRLIIWCRLIQSASHYPFHVWLSNIFLIIPFQDNHPWSIIDFLHHHPFNVWLSFSYSIMHIWSNNRCLIIQFFLIVHFQYNYPCSINHLMSNHSICFSLSFSCLIIQYLSHYQFPGQLSLINYWFSAPSSFSRLIMLFVLNNAYLI